MCEYLNVIPKHSIIKLLDRILYYTDCIKKCVTYIN